MQIDFNNKVYTGSNGRQSLMDCRIPDDAKGVIVFAHGYKGYKDWGAWQLMENAFIAAGFGFVKFNMTHNGGTVEQPIDFPDLQAFGENCYSYELFDLNLIIEETDRILRQELASSIPVYLMGHSRGGGVSVLVAAQQPIVQKVISLAGISDIATRFPTGDALLDWQIDGVYYVQNGRTMKEMPHFYSFYEDFKENEAALNIEEAAGNLKVPFLQIHGDMDLAVSISEGLKVAQWTDTRVSIIKGAGHTFGAVHPWTEKELPADLLEVVNRAIDFFEN